MKKRAAFLLFVFIWACGNAWAADNTTAQQLGAEMINKQRNGSMVSVDVFTAEKNEEQLIKINDFFLKQFLGWYMHIYITYFDDKEIAKTYAQKTQSSSASKEEKNQLFSHITAAMQFNSKTGIKIFQVNRQNKFVTVKKY